MPMGMTMDEVAELLLACMSDRASLSQKGSYLLPTRFDPQAGTPRQLPGWEAGWRRRSAGPGSEVDQGVLLLLLH